MNKSKKKMLGLAWTAAKPVDMRLILPALLLAIEEEVVVADRKKSTGKDEKNKAVRLKNEKEKKKPTAPAGKKRRHNCMSWGFMGFSLGFST